MDIGYSTAEPATAVVLMTAYQDLPTVATAMREGAVDFMVKAAFSDWARAPMSHWCNNSPALILNAAAPPAVPSLP